MVYLQKSRSAERALHCQRGVGAVDPTPHVICTSAPCTTTDDLDPPHCRSLVQQASWMRVLTLTPATYVASSARLTLLTDLQSDFPKKNDIAEIPNSSESATVTKISRVVNLDWYWVESLRKFQWKWHMIYLMLASTPRCMSWPVAMLLICLNSQKDKYYGWEDLQRNV